MINFRNLLLTVAALAVISGGTSHAASVSISLDSPSVFLLPGQTAVFHGTITNLEAVTVDLSNAVVNIPGPFTDDGGILFASNAPFFLFGGQTSDPFDMFSITVPATFSGPWGTQPQGTFTVFGGVEFDVAPTDGVELGRTNFSITVAPEPGTFALLGLALPVACVLKRRLV